MATKKQYMENMRNVIRYGGAIAEINVLLDRMDLKYLEALKEKLLKDFVDREMEEISAMKEQVT